MTEKQKLVSDFFGPKIKVLDKIGCLVSVIEFIGKWITTDLITALSSLGALYLILSALLNGTFRIMYYLSGKETEEPFSDENYLKKSRTCKFYFWGLTAVYYVVYFILIDIVSSTNVNPIRGILYSIAPPAMYSILTIYLKAISSVAAHKYAELQTLTMLFPGLIVFVLAIMESINKSGVAWGLISGTFIAILGLIVIFIIPYFISAAVTKILE